MAKTPDEIVADIDRQQNEEDLDLPRRAASFAKDKYNSLLQAGMGMMGKSPKEDKRLLPEGASNLGQGLSDVYQKTKNADGMKKGGKVKSKTSSASKRADGCAQRGKTKGKYL